MVFLSERSKQALSASLWRAKVILGRDRKAVIATFSTIVIFSITLIVLTSIQKNNPANILASQSITVTSTSPFGTENFFNTTSITGNYSLPNCSRSNFMQNVGYVLSPQASIYEVAAVNQTNQMILQAFKQNNPSNPIMNFIQFQEKSQLDSYTKSQYYYRQQLCFSYEYTQFDLEANAFSFDLYFDSAQILSTKQNQTSYQSNPFYVVQEGKTVISGFTMWDWTGFQQLMTLATQCIITQVHNSTGQQSNANFSVAYLPMNTGSFNFNPMSNVLVLVYVQTVIMGFNIYGKIVKLLYEKEERTISRMLRLSGMTAEVEVLFDWIMRSITSLPIILFLTLIGKFTALQNVSFGVIFLLLLSTFIQTALVKTIFTFGFGRGALSVLLNISYTLIMILFTILLFFKQSITQQEVTTYSLLFPNMQIQFFGKMAVNKKEDPNLDSTINITNLGSGVFGVTFTSIIVIGLINIVFYSFLLVYLWPLYIEVDEERQLRFYYPFTCKYWRRNTDQNQNQVIKQDGDIEALVQLNNSAPLLDNQINSSVLQQQEQVLVQQGIIEGLSGNESADKLQITELTKNFGKNIAVNKLSLTLFKDQILVLLGHNGAGKTTTISMLTGQLKASSGSALAFGVDILKMESSSDMISVCPQNNILITKLTVLENLLFFSKLRGVQRMELKIEEMLEQFKMKEKKNCPVNNLSGGQKRKLQLMISLCGNSKIILLDEPSSGMDPNLRRETWKILKNIKIGKIIIMTTHYMDEAEQLGDRVAIVSHGQLKCCGTPLFLKSKFSDAFLIQITKLNREGSSLNQFDILLRNYLAKIDIQSDLLNVTIDEAGKYVYTVPKQLGKYFQILFREVDYNLEAYNIQEYTIRTSSLEEVFIQIGENEKDQANLKNTDRNSRTSSRSSTCELRTEIGEKNIWRTFKAFFFMNLYTKVPILISSIFLSAFFCGILMTTLLVKSQSNPNLQLSSVAQIYGAVSLPLQSYYFQPASTNLLNTSYFASQDIIFGETTEFTGSDQLNVTQSLQNWADWVYTQSGSTIYGNYYVQSVPSSPTSGEQLSVAVYGNLISLSSQNVFGALMLNQIAQYYTNNPYLTIQFNNSPQSQNRVLLSEQTPNNFVTPFCNFLNTIITILSIFIVFLTNNRFDTGYYNQLMMKSGCKWSYLFSLYLSDFILHLCVMITFLTLIYWGGIRANGFWLPSLLFCITNPIFILNISYYIGIVKRKSRTSAAGILGITSAFVYFNGLFSETMMWNKKFQTTGVSISYIFAWIPLSNLCNSMYEALLPFNYATWHNESQNEINSFYLMKPFILAQVICLVIYSLLLTSIITGRLNNNPKNLNLTPTPQQNEDPLVIQERNRVRTLSDYNKGVKVVELVKKYEGPDPNPQEERFDDRPVELPQVLHAESTQAQNAKLASERAVNGVSFGVEQGEIFALLGLSGAGKSSTFSMLLGDELISGGMSTLSGVDVKTIFRKPEKLFGLIGYCPQTNSIEDGLTVRQSLFYLCETVGVRRSTVETVIKETMARFDLSEFANTKAGQLSGGNKRKLCCAQAVLGNPKIIIVDEVSAGVDPVARRIVWQGMRFESQNSALLLTTHTMEEAEALATKIGIMASGKLKCFGSLQQIQKTYGSGFEIEINLKLDDLSRKIENIDPDFRFNFDLSYIKDKIAIWQQILEERGTSIALELSEEFNRGGIFSNYYEKIRSGEKIDLLALQKDLQVQNEVAVLVQELSDKVSETSVVAFDGAYLQLRLQKKETLTYGQLYGFMESLQERFAIKEYSCKQATLEQIFISFAKQDDLRIFNQRVSMRRASGVQ